MKIALDRAKAGAIDEIANRIWDYHSAGLDWTDAVQAEVVDQAVARYSKHIRAALRKYGFDLPEDEPVTADVLLQAINERTGLGIASLTPHGVSMAVDAAISGRVSDVLGVELATITSADQVKAALLASAREAVESGRATKLVSKTLIKKMRERRTWKVAGVDKAEEKKIRARWYQKKYRRTHVGVWRDRVDLPDGGELPIDYPGHG